VGAAARLAGHVDGQHRLADGRLLAERARRFGLLAKPLSLRLLAERKAPRLCSSGAKHIRAEARATDVIILRAVAVGADAFLQDGAAGVAVETVAGGQDLGQRLPARRGVLRHLVDGVLALCTLYLGWFSLAVSTQQCGVADLILWKGLASYP
jgi:hypothetical protein